MTNIKNEQQSKRCLYDRIGGDEMIAIFVDNFFDEVIEDAIVGPFFANIPIHAFKTHEIKFYKVVFGEDEDLADPDALKEYLMVSHSRLFMEMGLTIDVFDRLVECATRAMVGFCDDPDVSIQMEKTFRSLRPVFEHCELVAAQTKDCSQEELQALPVSTAAMIGSDVPQRLPSMLPVIPSWLPSVLGHVRHSAVDHKTSAKDRVRVWASALTDLFQDNDVIADVFMDMHYLYHHVYTVNFLALAFVKPEHDEYMQRTQFLGVIQYPRGPNKHALVRSLYQRMIQEFSNCCDQMEFDKQDTKVAVHQLESYSSCFLPQQRRHKVGFTPHILHPLRDHSHEQDHLENHSLDGSSAENSCSFSAGSHLQHTVTTNSSHFLLKDNNINKPPVRKLNIPDRADRKATKTPFVAKILKVMHLSRRSHGRNGNTSH